MTQRKEHSKLSAQIDSHLLRDEFEQLALATRDKYQPWYAQLLTSLALLAHGEDVVYAQAAHDAATNDARVVVYTSTRVLIAELTATTDVAPIVQATARSTLTSMELSASARIDAHLQQEHVWPGTLNLTLTYSTLDNPIKIEQDGANLYSATEPSPIVTLIHGLTTDLGTGQS